MLGLPILDVAIGIAFFFLMFAMICTTANESLSRWFNKRPKTLEEALGQLLGSESVKNAILRHPLIAALSRKSGGAISTPSYIPASTFATALLDYLTGPQSIRDAQALQAGIQALPPDTAKALTAIYRKVNGDWDQFHQEVEGLYKNAMDRASGWYKRYIQKQTKILAVVIVLWADFDALHVAERLWTDSALRSAVVEDAKARAQARNSGDMPLAVYNQDSPDQGTAVAPGASPITENEQTLINSITGWERDINELSARIALARKSASDTTKDNTILWLKSKWLLMHLLGWLVSIFAISLGAPFWFDVLNRFMNLRSAGRSPDEPRAKNSGGKAAEAQA
jgi:hypothetical protein